MQALSQLFERWAGEPCQRCDALGANGSSRRYFRMAGATHACIGAINADLRENKAFFSFARQLRAAGVRVPELYAVGDDGARYLQQDLGDTTLYSVLRDKRRQGGGFDREMVGLYRRVLADLVAIQQAGTDFDFGAGYPRPAFDRRAILWDLNYFKYYFIKLAHIPFDEDFLEDDFCRLADRLLEADCRYFLYRDFQGRNIMLCDDELYYIDFQGGRQGAAQYDVASLLYSAKSDLPDVLRRELLDHYLDVRGLLGEARQQWLEHFWRYVLLRIMQTLGAYGYRGLFERKPYFIESIPLAVANLRSVLDAHPLPDSELARVLRAVCDTRAAAQPAADGQLTVDVMSFSYKRGLPDDPSGNGGGFVFDCRALPNPGRYPQYQAYTGRDASVVAFLKGDPAVEAFLDNAQSLVGQAVEKYLERHFTHLSVSFGCTGGQHRSVYCAERMAEYLRQHFKCRVQLSHREQ